MIHLALDLIHFKIEALFQSLLIKAAFVSQQAVADWWAVEVVVATAKWLILFK